jgi:hypothetical protein
MLTAYHQLHRRLVYDLLPQSITAIYRDLKNNKTPTRGGLVDDPGRTRTFNLTIKSQAFLILYPICGGVFSVERHIFKWIFLSVVWFLWNVEDFAPELHRNNTINLERWCELLSVREGNFIFFQMDG